MCDNMRMMYSLQDPEIRNSLELSLYRRLLSYCSIRHSLVTSSPWPSHPERTVFSHQKSGRWYAVGLSEREEGTGNVHYAFEIMFDPSLIPLLQENGYCAKAEIMDRKKWLRLLILDDVQEESYRTLIDLGFRYAKDTYRDPEGETVYTDAPIPGRVKESIPGQIIRMRGIRPQNAFNPRDSARVFYEQALYMKDYEDDFAFRGSYYSIRPSYAKMTDAQLRGYFTWRKDMRENGGLTQEAPEAFLRLYVYELLHLVHGNREETFEQLSAVEEMYAPAVTSLSADLKRWIDDFVIYYQLPEEYLRRRYKMEDTGFLRVLRGVSEGTETDDEVLAAALKTLSGKLIEKSAFLKKNEADALRLLAKTYRLLADAYRRTGMSFFKNRICMTTGMRYMMFASALFYEREKPEDMTVEISPDRIFRCRNGEWIMESVTFRSGWNDVVREADRILREALGHKQKLKKKTENTLVSEAIEMAVKELLEEKKEAAKPVVKIDMDALSEIRRTAAQTRDSLLVEEAEEEPETPAFIAPQPDLPETEDDTAEENAFFTAAETQFLKQLLNGEDVSGGDLLADSINEKMMDVTGDTVIEFAGGKPGLIEDYIEDIRKLI